MVRSGTQLETSRARVPNAVIRASLDAIRELLGIDFNQALYQYISQMTGIHPTTLLRYQLGRLETAPYRLSLFLVRLRRQIADGFRPPLKGRLRRQAPANSSGRGRRVSNARVQRLLGGLVERLQVRPNMFYRQVGAAVGLHPVTVLRHAEGQLASAPRRLFEYLCEMELALDGGQEVVFTRARLGTRVVPREFVLWEIQRLMKMRAFPSKRSVLHFVAAEIGMRPRSLERAYSSRGQVLLPIEVLHCLRAIIVRLEYAPEAPYQIGDRIFHPAFGCGVVVGKEHKDKLAVEFADGRRQVLRERLFEVREWNRSEDWREAPEPRGD